MNKLSHDDLLTLEAYARQRGEFRSRVLAHKKPRTVHLGAHMTLVFEDRLTIQYQIQEMLRAERIFEPAGIRDELDAYNPLIPDGSNLKATLLIEYTDPAERAQALQRLRGVEDHVHLEVEAHGLVTAVADEDLERSDDSKTSAVHFLRFELTAPMIRAWRDGVPVRLACTHPSYETSQPLDPQQRRALAGDFD